MNKFQQKAFLIIITIITTVTITINGVNNWKKKNSKTEEMNVRI